MGISWKCSCKVSLPLYDSVLVNPSPTGHKMQARFWRHIDILFDCLCPTPSHGSSSAHDPLSQLELADEGEGVHAEEAGQEGMDQHRSRGEKHIRKWLGQLASITTLQILIRFYALEVSQSLHVLRVPKVVVFMRFYRFGAFEMLRIAMIFKWSGRLVEPSAP